MRIVPVAYLVSCLLSVLGNSIAAIALPLVLLQTTGDVLGAGALAAATAIPAVLAGFFMGAVIDRVNRRTASVVTDLISASAVAALPIIDQVTGLTIGWFLLFGVLGSFGDVPGMTAREALLPAVVRHSGVAAERLVGLREGISALAVVIGPAAAGGLMTRFDGATVLWATAATSAAAALVTLLIPRGVGRVTAGGSTSSGTWASVVAGWRVLFGGNRFLLVSTLVSIAMIAVMFGMHGLVLPVFYVLDGREGLLGFTLSALAAGSIVGAISYAAAGRRGARRGWFVLGVTATVAGFALIGSLLSVPVIVAGAVIVGVATGWLGSLMGVVMIERVPDEMRGRVMGAQNALMTAAPALGVVTAALFVHFVDLTAAGLVLAGIWALVAAVALAAPALRDLGPTASTSEGGEAGAEQ